MHDGILGSIDRKHTRKERMHSSIKSGHIFQYVEAGQYEVKKWCRAPDYGHTVGETITQVT